ncbi:hypothetical protein B0H10DRAFT_2075240 [Mycena sp. CBHHK59/15]|nr:hypothetical protein B0H10DRAFT_2075240 [Mycena sp. CBHHK59/15]
MSGSCAHHAHGLHSIYTNRPYAALDPSPLQWTHIMSFRTDRVRLAVLLTRKPGMSKEEFSRY